MKKFREGFTLIELMIVVAILGIVAAVALPAYQDYYARTQASEAVMLLSALKTPVSEYMSDKGIAPDNAELAAFGGVMTGKYVASITVSGTISNLVLTATMKASDVAGILQGKTVLLTTLDGGKTWKCEPGTILPRLLPLACRG